MDRPRSSLVSLFLLSLAVLVMQVCLTRVYSVLSWHHFAYLIISLALLGYGAAGSYVTVSRRFGDAEVRPARLAPFAWLFSVTAVAAIIVASKIRFYPVDIVLFRDYSNAVSLLLLYVVTSVPFFFAGVCIGRLVSLAGDRVNQFYFADLLGAGAGALASLAVINRLGPVAGVFLAATLAALAACLLGIGRRRWRRWAFPLTLLAAGGLTLGAARTDLVPLYYPPSKDMFRKEGRVAYSRWHVVGKIDVLNPSPSYWSFGGALAQRYTDPPPVVRGIFQDGAAPTGIMHLAKAPEEVPLLGEYLQGVAYTVRPVRRALVIGIGGGIDGLIALHHGTDKVVGVDLNPVTVEAMQVGHRDECPALWREGRVDVVVAEGRHYLTRTGERFDVIQLSGVDTFTALSSGAYALSENFLYTREAMRDFWNHLTDDGILSFSRWLFDPPRETLRLVATQAAALSDAGVEEPWRHIVVLAGPAYKGRSPWADTLLARSAFTPEEVASLTKWAEERGFDVLYDPHHKRDGPWDRLLRASAAEREAFIEAYPFNIRPTSDDDPFFFQFYRWRSLVDIATGGKGGLAGSSGGYGITRVPLGLMILALSLVQMVVLAVAFILVPLLMRSRQRTRGRGRFGVFLYFAALGLGFMFIEIALLQKFSVFVGGPVYSMAITLAAILVFSGIGAQIGRVFRRRPGHGLVVAIGLVLVATVGEILFLRYGLGRLMGLSLPLRWLVTAGALLPAGIVLGMPFPTGLRLVERLDESLRPWAWGVNAFATVIGSMLCVLISIHAGFTTALLSAMGIYAVGGLGMLWAVWRNRATTAVASR